MERVCFTLQVRQDLLDEYRRRHAEVWPEMLEEIRLSGRRNYSLFLRQDGLLVGYYEADSDTASADHLASSAVAARWEAEMKPFFVSVAERADQDAPRLDEVFHLEAGAPAAVT
ncbi:L-rhamnose mutarotase [Lacisediminihabitans sp.]|uniref:L-rhamnose mutarotase n=1 Tax=Lacisediminihabitans sp. TaxID=2787631 RepID=UPI00374D977D